MVVGLNCYQISKAGKVSEIFKISEEVSASVKTSKEVSKIIPRLISIVAYTDMVFMNYKQSKNELERTPPIDNFLQITNKNILYWNQFWNWYKFLRLSISHTSQSCDQKTASCYLTP